MSEIVNLSRRGFLKAGSLACGGLVLGFYLSYPKFSAPAEAADLLIDPNAFLRIGTDETITMVVNKSEMGQGVYTSVPMLISEELECDLRKVRVQSAPVNPVYNNPMLGAQVTGGSSSIRSEWERMRKVGAAARMMLIGAAAKLWKVKASSCRAENGGSDPLERQVTYLWPAGGNGSKDAGSRTDSPERSVQVQNSRKTGAPSGYT